MKQGKHLDPHRDARKSLFFVSLGLSFLVHAAAIWLIQTQSLWVASKAKASQSDAPWLSYIEKQEKDLILKEAFQPSASSSGAAQPPLEPRKEILASEISLFSAKEPLEWPDTLSLDSLSQPLPFPVNELLSCNRPLPSAFNLPSQETRNLFNNLPKDLIVPAPSRPPAQPSLPPPLPLRP